jgi:hypothetical protein
MFRMADFEHSDLPKLPPAGVLVGEGHFTKTVFIEDSRLDTVTFLGPAAPNGTLSDGLLVLSSSGALFLDASLTEQSYVALADSGSHIDAIDVNHDGAYEYLRRGGWSEAPGLLSNKGEVVWTYDSLLGVNDLAAGDLTGDGTCSFAAGFNGIGGIHRVSADGKKVWSKSGGNIWHVEILDTDNDGVSEIIHSDASGKFTVRDPEGKVIRTARTDEYLSYFSPCKWPGAPDETLFIVAGDGRFLITDTKGRAFQRYDAPKCDQLGDGRGTAVTFESGQPPYFAALVTSNDESCLYIYDAQARLVYQESLGEPCESLIAWPEPNGAQSLLVGGHGRVWQFRPASFS